MKSDEGRGKRNRVPSVSGVEAGTVREKERNETRETPSLSLLRWKLLLSRKSREKPVF